MGSGEKRGADTALIGKLVDERYKVTYHLGRGGMANVYLAKDIKVDRRVVLKIPHPQFLMQEGFRERFEREIGALTRLQHPNIVGVIDVGTMDDDTPFAVLQYLGGGSLKAVVEKAGGKLTEKGLAELRDKMPHTDLTEFEKDPDVNNIADLFTVDAIVNFVEIKVA